MKAEFYSEDILNTYLVTLKKTKSIEERIRKAQYIIDWLNWLKTKQLITEQDYLHAISSVHKQSTVTDTNPLRIFKISNINRRLLFICLLLLITTGVFFYILSIKNNNYSNVSYKSIDTSFLPYKGRLLDEKGLPITSKTDITFRIYESPNVGKALYIGACRGARAITPDHNGNFTIVLGSDCGMSPLPSSLFEQRTELYLGVQVSSKPELVPRQKIFTSAYSSDAARLQGLTVGTDKDSIPFINKIGEVILKHTNPYLRTLDGTFTIESPAISIKTTGEENASILFQPASTGNTIVSNGKFSVGTNTPVSILTAQAIEPYSTVGTLANIAPEDNDSMSVLNLHLSTPPTGTESRFLQFFAGSSEGNQGKLIGSIRLNNEGVAYETAGADFAEYFESDVPHIEPGYIMTISEEGIHKSRVGERIIGVTSDIAGFIGNKKITDKNNVLIGIQGQVNVYVLNVSGDIKKGELVGLSQVEGYGQKQTEEKNVLGIALENSTEKGWQVCPQTVDILTNVNLRCTKIKVLLK